MKICNKCGKEIDEEKKFCMYCGARADGKKECSVCGATIDDDSVYCTACGERIDGKVVCEKCGKVMGGDLAFCSECGNKLVKTKTTIIQPSKPKALSLRQKIFSYVENGLYLAAILVAFICSFFIGIGATVSMTGLGVQGAGNAIDFMKSAFAQGGSYTLIIAAVILILNIVVSFAMLVISALMYGIKRKNVRSYAIVSIAMLLVSAMAVMQFTISGKNEGMRVAMMASGGTIAALVLALVFYVASEILVVVDEKLCGEKILYPIMKLVTMVVTSIAVLGAAFPMLASDGALASVGIYMAVGGAKGAVEVFAFLFAILAGILLGLGLLLNELKHQYVYGIVFSSIAFVFEILSLVFCNIYCTKEKQSFTVAAGIIFAFIFACAALALAITSFILKKAKEQQN